MGFVTARPEEVRGEHRYCDPRTEGCVEAVGSAGWPETMEGQSHVPDLILLPLSDPLLGSPSARLKGRRKGVSLV